LLWAYQRVALGEVTVEKNRTLPDASNRERLILATIAIAILFMGVASPLFTRRMESATDNFLQHANRPQNASHPKLTLPSVKAAEVAIAGKDRIQP
jgi:NADH:ubiquinone oxidoreductase subunit 4 (subunit M)